MTPRLRATTLASALALSVALTATAQAQTTGDLDDLGFSITVGAAPAAPRAARADAGQEAVEVAAVERLLDRMGLQVRYSGLGATPKLNVATPGLTQQAAPGERVVFDTYTNYPAWIARAHIVVRDPTGRRVIARLPVTPGAQVAWTAPRETGTLTYALEVFDAKGRRDSTRLRRLDITPTTSAASLQPQSSTAVLADDYTARRSIPVRGGVVTVLGTQIAPDTRLSVMGEDLGTPGSGPFAIERILPPGSHGITVAGAGPEGQDSRTESVDIPASDWFYTAMADITIGREFEEGRLAGFAEGVRADGTRITARIDTQERPLDELFDDFWAKDPKRTLRDIDPSEPFLTYGDDSTRTDLAPSSGRLFLRVQRDNAYVQWGDFDTDPLLKGLARDSRQLYGASAQWQSLDRTPQDEAKRSITAYAAAAETAVQRDVIQASGGSSFFLSRRDLVDDSATVSVEIRDRVSGQVLERRPLVEGVDYRINPIQGVVLLAQPLPFVAGGDRLVGGGRGADIYLVASYEYVPASPIDGTVAGGRAEGWITDELRAGVEGRIDSSTTPTTRVVAGDLLYAPTARTSVLLEIAQSEGPGRNESVSQSSGLVFDPDAPGAPTSRARGTRITAVSDLADLGLPGGQAEVFLAQEDAGFVGPDGVRENDTTRGRIAAAMPITPQATLSFGTRFDREDQALSETESWVGAEFARDARRSVQAELRHTTRSDDTGAADNLGERTDVALRHTTKASETLSWWVYGQATVQRTGAMRRDDRVGAGMARQISPTLALTTDLSYGTLGWGAEVGISETRAGTTRQLSYRLDPQRRFDEDGFLGRDRGVLVASSDRALSDTLTQTSAIEYDAFGARPSQTLRYGLAWAPREAWRTEVALLAGAGTTRDGEDVRKTGVSAGFSHAQTEGWTYALRGEWIRDRSDDASDGQANTDTYVLKGSAEARASQDWRFQAQIDGLWADSAVTGVGTGRFVETRLGFAHRPVDNDRTIALLSYTYLNDQPALGQTNFEGDTDGDGQRSHILNAALSRQVSPTWTLGAKYGLRHRTQFDRDGDTAPTSWSQLAILRADYHLTHKWDITGEIRGMWHEADSHEYGALVAVTRQVNPNLRLGVGYGWGGVSDDLRTIAPEKEGPFVNLTMSF